MPPVVVAEKSPMAWIELTRNRIARGRIAEMSNFSPNASGIGTWNHPADERAEKSTIPKQSATTYPQRRPIRIDASLKSPLP